MRAERPFLQRGHTVVSFMDLHGEHMDAHLEQGRILNDWSGQVLVPALPPLHCVPMGTSPFCASVSPSG